MRCAICSATELNVCQPFSLLHRVTSDCKPFSAGGQLAVCVQCGVIQKMVDEQWLKDIAVIYQNYEVYAQADGQEQPVFDQVNGTCCKRSVKLNQFIANTNLLQKNHGEMLDFGCANGEFLATFSTYQPTWKLYGADLGRKYEQRLKSITNFVDLYQENAIPEKKFDLITMIHTLEHLATPLETLLRLKKLLNPDGCLFIQVPSVKDIPYDILIADHLTHFTPQQLSTLLAQAGFKVKAISTTEAPKEISVLAVLDNEVNARPFINNEKSQEIVDDNLYFLTQMLADARALDEQQPFAIFGSSIAATWLASYLKNVSCFVDEDRHRVGKMHQGKPIYSLSQLPKNTPIYIALPTITANAIAARYAHEKRPFVLPPNIQARVTL